MWKDPALEYNFEPIGKNQVDDGDTNPADVMTKLRHVEL